MVVVAKKVGRLANRILLFAHFIAAATEHGFKVVNPAFDSYARYFPATSRDLFCRFPAAGPMPSLGVTGRSLFYHVTLASANALHVLKQHGRDVGLIRLRRDQVLDLDGPGFLAAMDRYKVVFVQDWFFRSEFGCEKHGDVIRSFFTPFEHHLDRVKSVLEPVRYAERFVVGVHVRQDDYAEFKGGQFLFSHRQYREVMEQVLSIFPNKSVAFLVCSDAVIPTGAFDGLEVIYGSGHELEDLYALAACDLLLGPPSTYSKWASFYGKVPRYEVRTPSLRLTPEQFRISSSLDHGLTSLIPKQLPNQMPAAAASSTSR